MTVDFKNDWKEFIEKEMIEMGFKFDSKKSLEQNTIRYFNTKRRIVSNKPRAIHESKELCVPSNHFGSYSNLKRIISHGGDIRPYLSRKIRKTKNTNDNDLLLNAWGIHHLHFLSAGTKDILFVKFTDTDAFIIQVLPHGRGHADTWVNTLLIEILHKNWPEIIAGYKVTCVSHEHLNAIERLNIRNKHANVTVTVSDGTCYAGPGGGIMASGACFSDIVSCDKLFENLSSWEKLAKANETNFRTALRISKTDPLLIKLMFKDQECWLHDPVRNVRFQAKLL